MARSKFFGPRRHRPKKQRCRTCGSDKGKRTCPALNGILICPDCCQAKRAKIPGCDQGCQHFKPLLRQSKFGPFPDYPIHKCLISRSKDAGMQIAVIVRRRPDGNLRAMFLLLDLWKKGVADCFAVAKITAVELERCCQRVAKSHRLSLPLDVVYGDTLSEYMQAIRLARSSAKEISEIENIALNKSVATNRDYSGRWNLTDGDTGASAAPEDLLDATEVTVDLGKPTLINTIKLWHYWADGRAYRDNKVAVSLEGKFAGEEIVIFDSTHDGEYPETREGKTFAFNPVETRYIRCWANGNTVNKWTHFVELQAFLGLNSLTDQAFEDISYLDCQKLVRHAYEISIRAKNEIPWELEYWKDFIGDINQIPYDDSRSLYRCPKCDADLPDQSVDLMVQYALTEDIQFYILCRKCGGEFD
ncbi:MAG: discoidin domain-containing protein [Candidatus Poribacteria bacterium]|nr:discoidin domain-containing protein [Candidatus Poribacteria bacterium]MDP6997496.1 discoidin domain-containing protein [Candidatus Poribacteria bacterium]